MSGIADKPKRKRGRPPKAAEIAAETANAPAVEASSAGAECVQEEIAAEAGIFEVILELDRVGVTLDDPRGEYEVTYTCALCGAKMRTVGVGFCPEMHCGCCRLKMQYAVRRLEEVDG